MKGKIINILENEGRLSSKDCKNGGIYEIKKTLRLMDSLKEKEYIKVIGNGREPSILINSICEKRLMETEIR